jgi:hypothetical protein
MKPFIVAALAAAAISFGSGCGDNPVTPEEHFEARGVILRIGDSTIVTVDSNRVTGGVRLDSVGQSRRIELFFILEDGTVAIPEHDPATGEEELGLDIRVADTTVVAASDLDTHDWRMTLTARRTASTTLVVALLHGGHDDFVSVDIPVVVGL